MGVSVVNVVTVPLQVSMWRWRPAAIRNWRPQWGHGSGVFSGVRVGGLSRKVPVRAGLAGVFFGAGDRFAAGAAGAAGSGSAWSPVTRCSSRPPST